MATSGSSTPVVTLDDWANAGISRNLIRVRPDDDDSLVKRHEEDRLTVEDRRYPDRLKQPNPQLASYGEVQRLRNLLESRYGKSLSTPKQRRAISMRVVKEIATHTGKRPDEIWKMTIGDAVKAIQAMPAPTAPLERRKGSARDSNPDEQDSQVKTAKRRGKETAGRNRKETGKRRGNQGRDAVERFAEIKRLYDHEFGDKSLDKGEYSATKKRVRNWLGRNWDKEYKDGGGKWRDDLSEDRKVKLCEMRSELLKKWRSGDTKNAD